MRSPACRLRSVLLLIAILGLGLLNVSCGGEGGGGGTPTQPETPRATSISLSSSSVSLDGIGTTYQFTATVKDQSGQTMSGASVTWSSSDPTVVTISSSGLATAVAVGTATISATSGTASSSASLAVTRTLSSASELLTFSFTGVQNAALSGDVTGLIEGNEVTILIPASVDATQMIASFTVSPAATVEIDGVGQVDGETRNDFTNVIRYTVIAEDQSTSTYTVYLGRLLEEGENLGWQRDVENFSLFSDPRDIKLLEELRVHFDSTWARIADTLNATVTETITIHVYPTKASLDDFYRSKGWDTPDWAVGSALGSKFIVVLSANSPDKDFPLEAFLGVALHEATHSIVATFGGPGNPVPSWINEGLAVLGKDLLAECFPDCSYNWDFHRSVIATVGKPDLVNMFDDAQVGYAFCFTTVLFIVKEYGWVGLQTFLTDFHDFSVFGMADSDAFEAAWYVFLDELLGPVNPGNPPVIPIAEARTRAGEQVSVRGTVTWQLSWNKGNYYLQDETAGINAYQGAGVIDLAEGDLIEITGEVGPFRGKLQITAITALTVLSHDALPSPRVVSGAQINGGEFQGELVLVEGTVQAMAELAYGNQLLTVRDSAGTDFPVFVDARTEMTSADWPVVGTAVRMTGVLGNDDRTDVPEGTGPRLEVRRKEDVVNIS